MVKKLTICANADLDMAVPGLDKMTQSMTCGETKKELNSVPLKRLVQKISKRKPNDDHWEPAVTNNQPVVETFVKEKTVNYRDLDSMFAYFISLLRDGYLEIPEGITEIHSSMFDGGRYTFVNGVCMAKADFVNKITSIFVPETVKTIESRAFAKCENLEKIILSEGIVELGSNVFTDCRKLKQVLLPNSVKKVNGWTFFNSGLTVPVFSGDGKVLVYYPQTAPASAFAVPEGVEKIGSRAFIYVKQLKNVLIDLTQQVTISCNSPKYRTASMR